MFFYGGVYFSMGLYLLRRCEMKIGFINRILEVLGLLVAENKKLQTENSILRVVLKNLTSDLSEDEKKEIEELIRV